MIGTLKESSLHATLKQIYREPGDKIEKQIDNYIIDIVRDNLLVEIQTQNFSAIKNKLKRLLENYRVLLVYPIIQDKWIIKLESENGKISQKRISPKHESYLSMFKELIYISDLISNPNLIIEVILIQAEEIRINDGLGSWRRKGWSISDRNLIKILDHKIFSNPSQFMNFIPNEIELPFTNRILAKSLDISINLARLMTYSLRKMELIQILKKVGNTYYFGFN